MASPQKRLPLVVVLALIWQFGANLQSGGTQITFSEFLARVESTKSQTLRAGDIVANSGHVVMVDKVGSDYRGATLGRQKPADPRQPKPRAPRASDRP